MEELLDRHNAEAQLRSKTKILAEVCEDIFSQSPLILNELLDLLLKKYSEDKWEYEVSEENRAGGFLLPDPSNEWNLLSLAEDVASVAQQALEENGFVYDSTSGLYYDRKLQCHYNPDLKLYYYHQTGAYYVYDEESLGLKFYCAAGSATDNPQMSPASSHVASIASQILPAERHSHKSNSSDDETNVRNYSPPSQEVLKKAKDDRTAMVTEEDECTTDSDEELLPAPVVIEAAPRNFEPDHSKHIAPCIRVIVLSTLLENLSPGTLFIVTCTGGTLGREGDHDVLIPDQLVSKLHASFRYIYKVGSYFFEIVDKGSKNGTYLNGNRLSDSLVESEPFEVSHGSLLRVGGTELLCHIHPKDETCHDCEGYYHLPNPENKRELGLEVSLKAKYNHELFQIRKKFGLVNWSEVKLADGYEDRAVARWKKVGSSHSAEKTQTASLHLPMDKQNRGFALMTKMGWVEGMGVGKNNGNVEPIIVPEGNEGKLGLGCEKVTIESQKSAHLSKKFNIAKKTLERFLQLQD